MIFIYLYYAKIIAEIRNCKNCENFIPFKRNQMHSFGFCKLFPLTLKEEDNSNFVYEFTMNSRNNESLCGKVGFYYSEKSNKTHTTSESNDNNTIKQLIDDYSLFLRRPPKAVETDENNDINNDINNSVKKMMHEYNIYLRPNQAM